jgi:hypothetical protein
LFTGLELEIVDASRAVFLRRLGKTRLSYYKRERETEKDSERPLSVIECR